MTPALSRRTLLLGAGAAVLLGGCSHRANNRPVAPGTPTAEARVDTVDELLASPRFLVAHRGSGDSWPEHTQAAYLNALAAGASAVEISVRRTADGVLVCHHDEDTRRTTGKKGKLADLRYADLADRPVDARAWLGPAAELEPIPKLADVLAALPAEALVFIEDKDGSNTQELLDLIERQQRATERFVWKQWAGAAQVQAAAERGFRAWGFLTEELLPRMASLAPKFDALGIGTEQSDAVIDRVVALGKPVMAWEVHRRSERERLRRLGVAGLMCSNVPYLLAQAPAAGRDTFGDGLRGAGDLPMITNLSWTQQPKIDPKAGTLTLAKPTEGLTYTMGSVCPLPAQRYHLTATLAWVDDPSDRAAGVAFAAESDAPYFPDRRNDFGAYQVRLNPDGSIDLCEHPVGWPKARVLGSLPATKLAKGQPVRMVISVTPYQIGVRRAGSSGEILVSEMNHRGGYVHLWSQGPAVRFSGIVVS